MKNESLFTLEEMELAKEYWKEKLSGDLEETRLIETGEKPSEFKRGKLEIKIPDSLNQSLVSLSKDSDMLLYVLLNSGLKVLLYKYLDADDIVTASPIYTTTGEQYDYNPVIYIRDRLNRDMTFKELLKQVKQSVIDGYRNQHYPLEKVLREILNIDPEEMSPSRVILLLENLHQKDSVDSLICSPVNDFALSFSRTEEGIRGQLEFNESLLPQAMMERFTSHYLFVLEQAASDINITLADIEILPSEEKQRLLKDFNKKIAGNHKADFQPKTLQQLFEEQVDRTPDHIAVRSALDLTDIYEALNSTSDDAAIHDRLERCCFSINPYIFETSMDVPGLEQSPVFLKTQRHNAAVVNRNMLTFIHLFDGSMDVRTLFHRITATAPEGYLLYYPVDSRDILEIAGTLSDPIEIRLDGSFQSFLAALKLAYTNNLIELTGFHAGAIGDGEDQRPPLELLQDGFIQEDIGLLKVSIEKALSPWPEELFDDPSADILLLGDTLGMPSVGLVYMASYLRRNGVKALCFCNNTDRTIPDMTATLQKLLDQTKPNVVGVSMKWALHMARVLEICRIVKDYAPQVKVVVGGNTAAYYAREVIQYSQVDYVVKGDGEYPILQICQGRENPVNTFYKKDGQIVENTISYIQSQDSSEDIYISNLDEIIFPRFSTLFVTFFITSNKGCQMNCLYCGGCKAAQKEIYGRTATYYRPAAEVRKDIVEAMKFVSTLKFDFETASHGLLDYCKEMLEDLDLSNHFCDFTNLQPPTPELIEFINSRFKYVYWNLDMASLSQRHRQKLFETGQLKRQPTDQEIFNYFDCCEKYENNELIVNLIAGLPYFNKEDMIASDRAVSRIIGNYSRFSALHWARLHAQPGAPIATEAEKFQMHSFASTFEEFLEYSRMNLEDKNGYPFFDQLHYPFVYFNDQALNSKVSQHYVEINRKVDRFKAFKREELIVYHQLSYSQLNGWANRLAHKLKEKGVKPEDVVPLMVANSLEVTVALLGILKSGAAYLPVDPEFPSKRRQALLSDCGARLLVVNDSGNTSQGEDIDLIGLSAEALKAYSPENPKPNAQIENLAYVIYTSGTTGEPNGVMIPHRGIGNFIQWRIGAYKCSEKDVTMQLLTNSFDGFGTGFYSTLLSGGTLIMIPGSKRLDLDFIHKSMIRFGITNISLVPGMYYALLERCGEAALKSLRFVVLGGEKAGRHLVRMSREKVPDARLINEYGPTETSVTAIVNTDMNEDNCSIIGNPIANTHIYILNGNLSPVPQGIAGELCIAGSGLAKAYFNRPQLTTIKFVSTRGLQSPYDRMYRTGDLARWTEEGDIQLLGRRDHQVKIRGYRIEPGEIEAQLTSHPGIKEAVVLALEDNSHIDTATTGHEGRDKFLCAYVVCGDTLDVAAIREYLHDKLPDFMQPSFIVRVEAIPLTRTGKLNRAALPDPRSGAAAGYQPPSNKLEETLAEVWQEILSIEKVGVNDSFFAIGGDSIKVIQMSSKLRQFGLKMEVKDIFEHPTIKQLAKCLKTADPEEHASGPEDTQETGDIPLTPVQHWFFQLALENPSHFNQSLMLYSSGGFDALRTERAMYALVEHHDALRMHFQGDEEVTQQVRQFEPSGKSLAVLDVMDFSGLEQDSPELEKAVSEEANRVQRGLNIGNGPLMRWALFKTAKGDHLLMVIHHLVVDAVSWRILVEDFQSAYRQAPNSIHLPSKTASYASWSRAIHEYAASPGLLKEREYWLEVEQAAARQTPLPYGNVIEPQERRIKDRLSLAMTFHRDQTRQLMTTVNTAYNTEINDILLATLALALNRWAQLNIICITLEGHGREPVIPAPAIDRTVGWFTAQYPLVIELPGNSSKEPGFYIKHIKETLRRVPNKGIGYDMLKYLFSEESKQELNLNFNTTPAISFNYLGELGASGTGSSTSPASASPPEEKQGSAKSGGTGGFSISSIDSGDLLDPQSAMTHAIDFSGRIMNGRLNITIQYNRHEFEEGAVQNLASLFQDCLNQVIEHCTNKTEQELTPSDLGDQDLSLEELDSIRELIS